MKIPRLVSPRILNHILLSCVEALPKPYRKLIYRYCKMYAYHYEGANPNIEKDGELLVIKQCISYCNIVFDVGANCGGWTKYVLAHNPKVKLHCFEPSIPTFEKLLSQDFPKNVVCNNFGLSSSDGKATMFIFSERADINSLHRPSDLLHFGIKSQEKKEIVTLRTLDDYCWKENIQAVDYLQIDVEGHELEVLRGSKEMLKQERIGIIQFEYADCNIDSRVFLKDLFGIFQGLSYEFYKILPMGVLPVSEYSKEFENFQYSNWLVIHKGHKVLTSLKIW